MSSVPKVADQKVVRSSERASLSLKILVVLVLMLLIVNSVVLGGYSQAI